MDQNRPSYMVAEEIDNAAEPTSTRKHSADKDADLQGRPLSEIIYMLRTAASYFIREIDSIPDLRRNDATLFLDYDFEHDALYIFKKTKEQQHEVYDLTEEEMEAEKERQKHEALTQWSSEDTENIRIFRKTLSAKDFNEALTMKKDHLLYKGRKYHMPFSPLWNKHEWDDIRLMQSIAGASLIDMKDIMRNYGDYNNFIDNNTKWRALLYDMYDAQQHKQTPALAQNPSLQLNTYDAVREQAQAILRNVNNVERKMTTLFSYIQDKRDYKNPEEANDAARAEAERITEFYNRNDLAENTGGRNNLSTYGELDVEVVVDGVAIPRATQSQKEFDMKLADEFSGHATTYGRQNNTPKTYQERVRLLTSYLSQNLRFAFKTSKLPLYVEKPPIEFADGWKGAIRDSITRFSSDTNYKTIIETYRDLLLPDKNEDVIAMFATYISKLADNTQMTMRPYQNNYALTHHQLDRNKIQYKAKEKEMDGMVKRIYPAIRKKKIARI